MFAACVAGLMLIGGLFMVPLIIGVCSLTIVCLLGVVGATLGMEVGTALLPKAG